MSPSSTTTNTESVGNASNTVPEKRKRSKYAARACVECKRRKVKCCGEQPCRRCRRRMMDCVFAADDTSSDSRNIEKLLDQISKMQSQIDTLTGSVGHFNSTQSTSTRSPSPTIRKEISRVTMHPPRSNNYRLEKSQSSSSVPLSATEKISYHGVTTSSFNFGIAQQSLRDRGITETEDVNNGSDGDDDDDDGDDEGLDESREHVNQEASPMRSPSLSPQRDDYLQESTVDPLWGMKREEAIRLCHVYEEEMGIMYPILDLKTVIQQVHALYDNLSTHSGSSSATTQKYNQEEPLSDEDINILKLVFACALTAEANGHSDLGTKLFRGVRHLASDVLWQPPTIKRVVLITLVSIYFFQIDKEGMAWRTIGTAQRLCLEMGLHRTETYPQPAIVAHGREGVLKLFWSIYTLDIRFSMGTGMPYHLDSSDIDPSLQRPYNVPYLNTMISYNRIAERVWRFITTPNRNQHSRKDEMAYLDWQVTQWYNSVPEFLKLPNPVSLGGNTTTTNPTSSTNTNLKTYNDQQQQQNQTDQSRSTRRLKSLLYLRANLMKILIYRPILYTPTQIAQSPVEASTVVEIAKNTICFITHLNQSTDIYQLQQVAFNWFLISALAVLFLAVAHAPAQFTSQCKDEFCMALGLIEGFSMDSYISQRLWKSIKGLRKLAPQIGLMSQNQQKQQQQLPQPQQQQQQQQQQLLPAPHSQGPATIAQTNGQLLESQHPPTHQPNSIPAQQAVYQTVLSEDARNHHPHHHNHHHPPPNPTTTTNLAPPPPYRQLETNPNPTPGQQALPAAQDFSYQDDFYLANGPQMSRELMDWFEALGDPNSIVADAAADTAMIDPTNNGGFGGVLPDVSWMATDDLMFGYGYGSELASILKDCF